MPATLTIHRVLDMSTAHLPSAEMAESLNEYDGLVAYSHGGYGWLVHVPADIDRQIADYGTIVDSDDESDDDDDRDGIPAEIVEIWRYAKRHDCSYVLLDRDGDVLPDLPSFDWD